MAERWFKHVAPRGRVAKPSFASLTRGEREFLEAILDDNDPRRAELRAAAAIEYEPPSAAQLFAEAILDNPPPRRPVPVAVDRTEDSASSATQEFADAILGRPPQVDTREFLAQVCMLHEPQPDIRQFLAQVSTLHEGTWDSSKHPRGGYPQNPGQFSPGDVSGGAELRLGGGVPIRTASNRADKNSAQIVTVSDKRPKQSAAHGDAAAPAPSPTTKIHLPSDNRGTWIKGTKGNGTFRYNDSIENQQAGVAGIEVRFKDQHIAIGGFPSESYYGGSAAKATVEINIVTGFDADAAAADAAMRQKLHNPAWQRPQGYKWNHAGPPGSRVMELVHENVHGTTAHKGPAAEPRAARRAAKGPGATGRAMGVLTVYLAVRDALQAGGLLQPDYVEAERETYHFVAEDGSTFVVRPAGLFSSAKREFVAGPRKGQTETITKAEVEQYRKKGEEEFGKYIPHTLFSGPRFIPGKQKSTLRLQGEVLNTPHDIGWIDEKGVHYFREPIPHST